MKRLLFTLGLSFLIGACASYNRTNDREQQKGWLHSDKAQSMDPKAPPNMYPRAPQN